MSPSLLPGLVHSEPDAIAPDHVIVSETAGNESAYLDVLWFEPTGRPA